MGGLIVERSLTSIPDEILKSRKFLKIFPQDDKYTVGSELNNY